MFLRMLLSCLLLGSPLMIYASEDINEKVRPEKMASQKQAILLGLEKTEFDQLMQRISFRNRMDALFASFCCLSLAAIMLNLLLLKLDVEAIRRAVA